MEKKEEKGVYRTPSYTRKAAGNYRYNHDFVTLTLEKGEKDLFKSVGMDNPEIIKILRTEFERRNAEITPDNDKSGKSVSDMTDDEKLDFFNV